MIVVGAGIIGLSCAWRLALQKIPVAIFDAGSAGSEASWAGAGMLAPGGEFAHASPLARMALTSLALYPEFVDELRRETGLPVDYRECGAFEIARDDREAGELEKRAACQSALGIRSEPARWASAAAARFYPDDALVNPRDVVAALRVACSANGVVFHEREPVVEVFAGGVRTARATYSDDGVLLAAGAWSSALATPFHLPAVSPVRGHLISYEATPGLLPAILRHGSTYLLQRENGTIVAGSSSERVGFDRAIDERIVQEIHVRALNLLPELAAAGSTDRWIGFRPAIEGEFPAVGRIEGTAVWTAFGHYRNGILLAPETARRIEQSVTTR